MNSPPRYVPTLTEVVLPRASEEGSVLRLPLSLPEADLLKPAPPAEPELPEASLQAELIERVLMRLKDSLDQRIQDAVAQVLLAHTEELALVLHETIDGAIRRTVSEALAQALGSPAAAKPKDHLA